MNGIEYVAIVFGVVTLVVCVLYYKHWKSKR